VLDGTEPP